MIHGGLRYLQQGDVRLVYEALAERQRLRRNAPHLVKVLPFLLPVFGKGGVIPRKLSRALGSAMWMYDLTGGRPHRQAAQAHQRGRGPGPHAHPAPRAAGRVVPLLRRPGRRRPPHPHPGPHRGHRLRRRGGQPHASGLGAQGRPAARPAGPGWKRPTGRVAPPSSTSRADAVVNAGGVWSDDVRQLDEGTHPDSIRPAKGVHITVPWSLVRNDIAVVIPVPRRPPLGVRGALGRPAPTSAPPTPTTTVRSTTRRAPPTTSSTCSGPSTTPSPARSPPPTWWAAGPGCDRWSATPAASAPPTCPDATR